MDRHPDARSCSCAILGATSCCPRLVSSEPSMNLSIKSTTGTRFELSLPREETVEGLKRRLAQKLRVPKERLALLHKDTRLTSGPLQDFGVVCGSKLTLVPSVESGLMSQSSRPEQSIMQALESLTETQVSDFLCGRCPLTLALRVGDHMMFVQLQLAAQQSGSQQPPHRHTSRGPSGTHGAAAGSSPTGSGHGPLRSPVHTQETAMPGVSEAPPRCPSAMPGSHSTATPCPQTEGSSMSTATGGQARKPGAVIESFVNHAPGVFSGTFSGTLHPSCQDVSGRPRRDISTILQILNDLLSATRHYQGSAPTPAAVPTLCHLRCPPRPRAHSSTSSSPPPSPSPSLSPPASPRAHTHSHTTGLQQQHARTTGFERERHWENRATRCKVERLQMLLQQRRLSQAGSPHTQPPHAWSAQATGWVVAGHSSSSAASSSSSSAAAPDGDAASLELEYEDAAWRPEGPPTDLSSEVIMA
ncbi:LOW QUALITY PROTEIN: midnolin-like [Alosa alosa]|uniref:LOW QUALITY PROTEIN: midnolin-like n=1 Tax=Alosa alosa TaxID=278164 RepID=UPI00201534D2|nr:LOW QUALITY PROTEIN: midnolin-like [Alosa alosa]